ncbi:MAG: AAA family ATPase [Bacteroidaceae bacterium]|nr:AAA family ATPase [Bacteroidaceae bacterium]
MINDYFIEEFKKIFGFKPTVEQDEAIQKLSAFVLSSHRQGGFILRGYAGTGKTALIGALVRLLDKLEQRVVLMAPTGRAAKVFSQYAGHAAYTIHKRIYRQKAFNGEGGNFSLADNLTPHTLFIVDEASMIANDGLSGTAFGTGRLLDDLINYVYAGDGCRLLLLGDTAQLPPVGEEESPALSGNIIRGYGMNVEEMDLTQVVRQLDGSGILWNATRLRHLITTNQAWTAPTIRLQGFADIRHLPGNELIETLEECYANAGYDETMVICRSNKRANVYNNGIRARILYREEILCSGDLVMIAKNNYFWSEDCKELDFIANGDIAVVHRVRHSHELYGFQFADVTLRFPDYDDFELEANVLLDTLQSDYPALSQEQNCALFNAVMEDYADIPLKQDRMKKMKKDPHFNALQLKYAYAITCHKAQGGQWRKVFLDQGYITEEMITPEYFRWLYTAFTRATETLYLVNFPKEQIE